ncbi:ComF family protein [Pararcticibacter amylolyticus]|uniref:ComF family protein n=1 Tax=Pararcticibacter amylolyticus TaxID=2173175 RepID=A0A2U2PHX2_9SPHI|nr:ComF family protein [Pararcticibacter amylolyticus]PWG80995.1 ComF family protein [Pararcticibacter amylolyticus]
MPPFLNYISDFFSLFFPEVCGCCGGKLIRGEKIICTTCRFDLPYTNFHRDKDNALARQFQGHFNLGFAIACFYFRQDSKVQSLIHQLKYRDRPETGLWLGRHYGNRIKEYIRMDLPELIIPVPLHKKRQKQRGYNQSECIAQGLSEITGIPVDITVLQRSSYTDTQTRKSRFQRFENMKDVFSVHEAGKVAEKHVLIVDDVITTGATIEACALKLFESGAAKVSISSVAFAV